MSRNNDYGFGQKQRIELALQMCILGGVAGSAVHSTLKIKIISGILCGLIFGIAAYFYTGGKGKECNK